MKLYHIFKRLGYPKHADYIYKVLSDSKKPLLVANIANFAKVSRTVVYRCLKKMEKDGLIRSVYIGRRKFYEIESLRKLTAMMKMVEKKTELEVEKYAVKREKEVPPGIRFLSGPAGIRATFDDVIEHTKKGETFYRYTSERDLTKVNQYLSRSYRDRRDQKKLERWVISNPISGKQKKSRLERFVKFISPEMGQFEQNIIQLVYGDRLAFIDLNKEEVVIIENKQLVDFQKVIFRLLYKKL